MLTSFKEKIKRRIDNENKRRDFVKEELKKINKGLVILDAGCGNQQYKEYAKHLIYKGQDIAEYEKDEKPMLGGTKNGMGGSDGYKYGKLDYVGDIININEKDNTFDAILCTEVLEHITKPDKAIAEFSRLLKTGGRLIITAPCACLRHMDPYIYSSGFFDRWYEKILDENGFTIQSLEQVGDYYDWLAAEIYRNIRKKGLINKFLLLPAMLYFLFANKTEIITNTMNLGYHVVAIKK